MIWVGVIPAPTTPVAQDLALGKGYNRFQRTTTLQLRVKFMALDIFALAVIALLIAFGIWLIVLLGNFPGDIARKRNHPQAEAITALSWIGLITGIGWFIALVWAYYKPSTADSDLQQQLNDIQQQLQQLQAGGNKS